MFAPSATGCVVVGEGDVGTAVPADGAADCNDDSGTFMPSNVKDPSVSRVMAVLPFSNQTLVMSMSVSERSVTSAPMP